MFMMFLVLSKWLRYIIKANLIFFKDTINLAGLSEMEVLFI